MNSKSPSSNGWCTLCPVTLENKYILNTYFPDGVPLTQSNSLHAIWSWIKSDLRLPKLHFLIHSVFYALSVIQTHIICKRLSMYLNRSIRLSSAASSNYARSPDVFPVSTSLQPLLGDPEASPGQMGYVIPAACSGSAPGSPIRWMCLEYPCRKASYQHPDQMLNTTGSF